MMKVIGKLPPPNCVKVMNSFLGHVGVFHELLSLSLHKRIPVPILGKFCDEYRFSNAFSTTFTRHSGIFYLSLKGGIETAVLRGKPYGGKACSF